MSESGSRPRPRETPDTGPGGGAAPDEPSTGSRAPESQAPVPAAPTASSQTSPDPLRGSRASGLWASVVALVVLLILLSVFILQNTGQVEITYFGWTGQAPLAAALLIAVAAGLLIAVVAGSLRILQLRRRVRRERKR